MLKTLRERTGISQAELARQVGISRQALHAIESQKQDSSLHIALRIADVLELPLQQIFFLEDSEMENTRTRTLTKVERLTLVNQYRALQAIHKDDDYLVQHYKDLETIFERGYVALYSEALGDLSSEVSMEVSDEVFAILDMHRALIDSLGTKPDPTDVEAVRFRGFDANNESEHLSFAKFYTKNGDKYSESRIYNSHQSTLPRYRKMLAEWRRMGSNHTLTKPQIDSILEAGTFKHGE